ncbi:MAG: hypothetical protein JO235_16060 [Chroococcidiopsidaceae cyanobacterium CP_BM_RX_35]|nr:hypothetical protein [Chroococcidiopsidaceae cyanobacterium CP_BM_RX_35]
MKGHFSVSSNTKNLHWLEVVETLSVIGFISSLIAYVVFQQFVLAAIPLSLFAVLNLMNRRRLLDLLDQSNQTTSTQLVQKDVATEVQLATLTEQLAEVRQLTTDLGQSINHLPITQFMQENDAIRTQLATLNTKLAEVQRLSTNLGKSTSHLQDYTQILGKEQTKIANKVSCLREIEICSQIIRINSNDANAYYNRGSLYQRLGYKEAAIWDYTEAIRIIPSHAKAYHARGLTRANLGDKKGAVEDLREAAKQFFEAEDILNYQTARELSKKFHELIPSRVDASEKVVAECLFS